MEGSSTFRWLRDGAEISGANANTYTVVGADNSTNLTFEVTPVANSGTSNGLPNLSSGITVEANSVPTVSDVTITDDNADSANIGDGLTGAYTYDDLEGDSEGLTIFRWLRDSVAIGGETGSTYALVAADNGANITFEVTPIATAGTTNGSAETSSGLAVNSIPTASNVAIVDDNGGNALAGDSLTGTYTFADTDGDSEGTSSYRWLKDGVEITGETSTNYVLVTADFPSQISFEVTAISATGSTNGDAVLSSALALGSPPVINGSARFIDVNNNGVNDSGDQLIIPFDQDIVVNTVVSSDLELPVTNDTFGSGAAFTAGPASNEMTVTMGTSPFLKSRYEFNSSSTTSNSASGINISSTMTANAIEGTSGIDAESSVSAVDIIFSMQDSGQSLGTLDNITYGIAVGDLDGDGDTDYIAANRSSSFTNRIYFNDGTGLFTDSGHTDLTNARTESIALGDIDGDGDLDYVTANFNQGSRAYVNDGNGVFTDSGQLITLTSGTGVKLADVDADGDLDMLLANDGQGNQIFTNDGTGIFTDSGQSLGSARSEGLAVGDIDNDGDLDFVVANTNFSIPTQTNSVYINDGNGVYTILNQSWATSNSHSIALSDFDSDGDLDIVTATLSGQNSIFINDGIGIFTAGQTIPGMATAISNSVQAADVDSDGDMDIIFGSTTDSSSIFINDGNAVFSDANWMPPFGLTQVVMVVDVNDDGDMDIIEGNNASSDRVYFNSLSASWGIATYARTTPASIVANGDEVELVDVDNDGDLDLLVTVTTGADLYLNDGGGVYSDANHNLPAVNIEHIQATDIDKDGDKDIIIAITGGAVNNLVYTNDGAGVFTLSQSIATNNSKESAMGDIDGDGDIDMVIASYNSPNTVWLNNGGVFTDSGQSLGSERTYGVALGDMDGDGDLDLVTANDSDFMRVYVNDGTGVFTQTAQTTLGGGALSLDLGDIDGDGDLDVVFGWSSNVARVFLNDGNGLITNTFLSLTGVDLYAREVRLADFDADGDLDLFVALADDVQLNRSDDPDMVYFNDGAGNFSDANSQILGSTASAEYSQSVRLDDIDNDGDIDAVFGHGNSPNVTIHINQ